MDTLNKISKALIELRTASLSIQSEQDLKSTMKRYDMLFLGDKFNQINSIELRHSLKEFFNLELSNKELLEYLPVVCKSLEMPLEALQNLDNLGVTSAYIVTLH